MRSILVMGISEDTPDPSPYPNSLIRLPESGESDTYNLTATFDFTGFVLDLQDEGFIPPQTPTEMRIYGYNVEGESPVNVIESYTLGSSLLPSNIDGGFVILDTSTVITVCITESNLFTHIGVELIVRYVPPRFLRGEIDTNRISFTACKV